MNLNGANAFSPTFARMHDPNSALTKKQATFVPNYAVKFVPAATGSNAGYCAIGSNAGIPNLMLAPATNIAHLQCVAGVNHVIKTGAAAVKPIQFANGVPNNPVYVSRLAGVPFTNVSHPGAIQDMPVKAHNFVNNAGGGNANAGIANKPESEVAMYHYDESSRNLDGAFQKEPCVTILDGDFLDLRGMEFVGSFLTKKTHDVIVVKDMCSGEKLVLKRFFKMIMKDGSVSTYCHDFRQETAALQRLSHPNIMQIIEAVNCPTYWAIVLPYYKAGNLSQRFPKIHHTQVPRYIQQLCLAVSYLHEERVAHGDIKANNVFLTDDDNIILADFGQSFQLHESHDLLTIWGGTPGYRAPEIFLPVRKPVHGTKMDVFALGTTIYRILTANVRGFGQKELNRFFFDDLSTFKKGKKYIAAVRRMMSDDCNLRPGMSEVLEIVL